MNTSKPRALTSEECKDALLNSFKSIIDYWLNVEDRDTRGKMEGLVFSILVTLDGGCALPKWVIAPDPHPSDLKYSHN
jgi:hypothetical protein